MKDKMGQNTGMEGAETNIWREPDFTLLIVIQEGVGGSTCIIKWEL